MPRIKPDLTARSRRQASEPTPEQLLIKDHTMVGAHSRPWRLGTTVGRGAGGCVSAPRGLTRNPTLAILAGEHDTGATGKQNALTTSNPGEETLMPLSRTARRISLPARLAVVPKRSSAPAASC